jgi:hypothetical protein
MANTFGYAVFHDDSNPINQYSVRMRSDVATQLGVTLSSSPTNQLWPYGYKQLRFIRAKGQTRGNYIRVTIPNESITQWGNLAPSPTTFTWTDSQTYTLTEKHGCKESTRR